MKNLSICTLLALLLFTSQQAYSQIKTKEGATFTIRPDTKDEQPDSILVQLFFAYGLTGKDKKNIIAKKNPDGSFGFSIPGEQAISLFRLFFNYPKERLRSQVYYAEPSDIIDISFKKESKNVMGAIIVKYLTFSGKGAAKYTVSDCLRQINFDLYLQGSYKINSVFGQEHIPKGKIEAAEYYKSSEFKDFLDSMYKCVQENIKRSRDTLLKYHAKLGKDIATFYSYELGSHNYFEFFLSQLVRRSTAEASKQAIINFYLSKVDSLKPKEPRDTLLKYSIDYNYYKGLEIAREINFKTKGRGYPLQKQYDIIKRIKVKQLRDILITQFLVDAGQQAYVTDFEKKDSCLSDALTIVKSSELIAKLNHARLFSKGSRVFDFSFPDSSGKYTGLKDLKGSVFIIDFYYYGCGPCSFFAKRFEREVYPEFENNPYFKVVSVNIDKTKTKFIQALNSGLYTQKKSINLYTGGLGFNFPMKDYYGFTGVPFVLLVDQEGRLISKISTLTGTLIRAMIRKALDKDVSLKSSK